MKGYAPEIFLPDDLYYRVSRLCTGGQIITKSAEYDQGDKPKDDLTQRRLAKPGTNPLGLSYEGPDSGCPLATAFLGRRSYCLPTKAHEGCPFDNCLDPR